MKRNLLILSGLTLGLLAGQVANAQVSITAAQLPSSGNAYVSQGLVNNNFTFAKSGTGLSWDFTTLVASSSKDTTFFLKPSSTPAAAAFPTASMASMNNGKSDVTYYIASSSDVKLLGIYADPAKNGNFMALPAHPALTAMTFPYTYLSTVNSSGYLFIKATGAQFGQPSVDSVKLKHTIIQSFKVTGTGTLKTPSGTFPNSLIERQVQTQIDSTWIKGSITFGQWTSAGAPKTSIDSTFHFYDGSAVVPSAEIGYKSSNGQISYISYLLKKTNTTLNINEVQMNQVSSVFPMPFANTTCFSFVNAAKNQSGYSLSIFDMTGKLVDQVSSITGNQCIYHNANLSKGIYVYRLNDGNTAAGQGKIIVE